MDISVIIPVWNRKTLVQKAIESVISQTYPVKELILIDDGSDDGTWEYIKTLHYDSLIIRKKHIPHCGMPGAVRNRGIEMATNNWLAFLDSDDYWLPHKLKMQVEKIQKIQNDSRFASFSPIPSHLFCHTKEIWLRNETIVSQKKHKHKKTGNIFEYALKKCIIGPSTVLIHRSIIEKYGMFNETLEIAEDYEYWLKICADTPVCYIETACVVKYSGGQSQLSHKYSYIEKFRIEALNNLLHENIFTDTQQQLVLTELKRKQMIWNNGKNKRQQKKQSNI